MSNKLIKIFNAIFLILFLIIFVGTVFTNEKWYLTILSFIIISLLLFIIIKKILKIKEISIKKEKKFYIFSFIIFLALQLSIAIQVYLACSSCSFSSAYNSINIYNINSYFLDFQNNAAILEILISSSKIFNVNSFQLINLIINTVIIDISYLFLTLSIRKLYGNRYSIITVILCFLFTPLFLYLNIYFIDVLAMCFTIIIFYLLLCIDFENISLKKNFLYLIFICFLTFINLKLRIITLFILLAFLVYITLNKKIKLKFKYLTTTIIIFIFAVFLILYRFDERKINLPYTHWIMLGIEDNNDIYYIYENISKKEIKQYNKKIIKEELKSRKIVNNFKFYYNKLINTWSDGTFTSYGKNEYTKNSEKFFNKVFSQQGKYYFYLLNGFHLLTILMFIISACFDITSKNIRKINIAKISIFMLLVFLLIWRSKSTYLISYIPIFLLVFIDGASLINNIFDPHGKYMNNEKIVLLKKRHKMKKSLFFEKLFDKKVKIYNSNKTLKILITSNQSIARFGDGELLIIQGENIGFQKQETKLSKKLEEVLCSKPTNCLIGVPYAINRINNMSKKGKEFWLSDMYYNRKKWLKFLSSNYKYCDSMVTRPYIKEKDKKKCEIFFNNFKKIWNKKNIIIVEGEYSNLGVGNDLFDNTKSIKRIICPSKDAFSKYDLILKEIEKRDKNDLILIALGPTATVLAYELSKKGYRALDIGHLDIEYEWFLNKAKEKIAIKGKYVNEVANGHIKTHSKNKKYLNQIIARIK